MKASELRIGNILNAYGYDVFVTKIDEKSIDFDCKSDQDRPVYDYIFAEDANPVLLDEGWLVMLGFVNYQGQEYHLSYDLITEPTGYESNDLNFVIDLRTETIRMEQTSVDSDDDGYFKGELYPVYPKHIHQLQNLYHALTGDELTIKNT